MELVKLIPSWSVTPKANNLRHDDMLYVSITSKYDTAQCPSKRRELRWSRLSNEHIFPPKTGTANGGLSVGFHIQGAEYALFESVALVNTHEFHRAYGLGIRSV